MERELNGFSIEPYSTGLGYTKSDAIQLLSYYKKELYIVSSVYLYLIKGDKVRFGGCHDCKRNENESWRDYVNRSNKAAMDYINKVERINEHSEGDILVYEFITYDFLE